MKKYFLIIPISVVILCFAFTVFATEGELVEKTDYNIIIGNSVAKLQYPIYMSDDRIYVSLRDIGDKLGIPVKWNEEKSEAELDIYNKKVRASNKTSLKEEGVIPDEQTALEIGKIILEKYSGKSMEYETDKRIYYLRASFLETENAWIVVQNFKYKKPDVGGSTDFADFANVKLNKNTGEVLYINTNSSFSD